MATTKKESKKTTATKNTVAKKSTSKAREVKIDEKNKANVEKAITKEKDLQYVYPEDCTTLKKRKKFRATARRKVTSFQKQIAKAESSANKKKLQKKARIWGAKTFTKGNNPFA